MCDISVCGVLTENLRLPSTKTARGTRISCFKNQSRPPPPPPALYYTSRDKKPILLAATKMPSGFISRGTNTSRDRKLISKQYDILAKKYRLTKQLGNRCVHASAIERTPVTAIV